MHGVRVYNISGKFHAGNQVFPMTSGEIEAASQRLIDVVLAGDSKLAGDLLSDPFVDVDFVGTVDLRSRKTELVPNGESAHRVVSEFEVFRTDVTALFLAAHSGNLILVRKLLSFKADVNIKLFRGYATTAAVRSGLIEILEALLKAGVSQSACEDVLLEASYVGPSRHAELLMGSNIISSQVAVHALVTGCCRGFLDVIQVLIKCGVDANAMDRMLLLSSKPYLQLNVDCNAIVAAIVSRQISVVELLLREGVRVDIKVMLGAWSWDPATGEECRVGAGLAEPYNITWCAVEYFEETGSILRLLLQHLSPNTPHLGRALIHHAILCNNAQALDVLLSCGADVEFSVKKTETRPIHMCARLGELDTLSHLINGGCNINSKTSEGETAVLICTRFKHECLKALALSGADFGLVDANGESASSIAGSTRWTLGFQQEGVQVDIKVRLGAWSWDPATGEECRVGAGLTEPYNITWCAVEYFEETGSILRLLLQHLSPNTPHLGRALIHHAILCNNAQALDVLLSCGADVEFSVKKTETRPIHMCARLGELDTLSHLINGGCNINSKTSEGETAVLICTRFKHECLKALALSGADFGLVDANGESASSIAGSTRWTLGFQQEGVQVDIKVRLGAWSWDPATGEECRVGAGLTEPYNITWCAVEYFEETGSILRLLLQRLSPNTPHLGRTLIHHAILCNNAQALDVLLSCGADVEFSVKKTETRPIPMCARLGELDTLSRLINGGCNITSKTSEGETAVMICTKYKHKDCLKALALSGADFGLVDAAGESATSIAGPQGVVVLDEQDENGFTAAMLAAESGQVEAFRLLVSCGADVSVRNKCGETALTLSEASSNRELFEKIMLDYALKNVSNVPTSSYSLHVAAREGDLGSVRRLTSMGYDVNGVDGDGYTPLMLAAKEGYGSTCQFLISRGAKFETETDRHETALSLTRKNGVGNEAEHVILDELARVLVLCGTRVKKHTKEGKGAPHRKKLKMIRATGVLCWGKSGKRNVTCRAAEVGPSMTFLGNRPKICSHKQSGLFHGDDQEPRGALCLRWWSRGG
ncbi:hypothetical protein SOVF_055350 [Spinacia oleracea]|nr:hypothetical protein SOVF_055350 [Spinacia oleracea]